VTDEGGKRRPTAGEAHPQGRPPEGRPSPSAASGLRAVPQAPTLQPQAVAVPAESGAGLPGRSAATAADPRPDATIRDGRPFERRRSTGRQERQARPDRRACWTICLCPREARRSRNGPPSRQGGAGRRPAAAFTRPPPGAPRARGCGTSPLAWAAGRAPGAERLAATRPHLKPRHRLDPPRQHAAAPPPHTHRAETPEPLEPPPTPRSPPLLLPLPRPRSYYLSPALAPAASPRVVSTVHPLGSPTSSTTHPICLPCTRCRRPASGPSSIPPGLAQPGLPGRSRKGGPARSGGPPFLAKPRRKAKETPEGGAAACCAQGRNP
jgi:hypothetical protein